MAPVLPLRSSDIADKARRDLLQRLESVRGKKNLVIEKSLAGTIGLFVKFSTLQEYGVDRVFWIENDNIDTSQRNVVFIARGDKTQLLSSVAKQIKRLRESSQIEHEFSIFWVPRRTLVSNEILEEAGVLGEVNASDYPLYFVPLSEDVLSLELEHSYGDLYLRKDPTSIFTAAKALMLIQQKHGLFPRIVGKGNHAKRLSDLLLRMRSEIGAEDDDGSQSMLELTPSQSLESLIILDREADFPTALLTQLTYEGLLDEDFGINSNQIDIDSTIAGSAPTSSGGQAGGSVSGQPQSLKRKVILDGSDQLYSSLRDANCAVIGPMLNKVARRLQTAYESRNTAAKTTAELREFVSKLPGYQAEQASLKLHTNLAEEVIKRTRSEIFTRLLEIQQNIAAGADPSAQHDSIEELIARDVPLPKILRLICLESTMSNGLKLRDAETFKRAIIQGYGHQHLLTWSALEKMGLIEIRAGGLAGVGGGGASTGKSTNYTAVRKTLSLINDEVNESEPDDAAYVFSGYAPLTVRLVQCILQKQYLTTLSAPRGSAATAAGAMPSSGGWRPFEDVVKQIRGATFDEVQTGEEIAVRARQTLNGSSNNGDGGKTVVVFFLGGVCRAEIAALRFIAEQMRKDGKSRRLVICTTSIVTGDRMMDEVIESKSFVR